MTSTFGPCLRVHGSSDNSQRWKGSVLVGVSQGPAPRPAVLLNDNGQQSRFEGSQIDIVGSTAMFRVDLDLPLTAAERTIHYFVDLGTAYAKGPI